MRKNFFFTLASQLLTVLTPLLAMPFVARRLLVENVGISSFTESIAYLFSLFAVFGCSVYGQREIAYCKGDERLALSRFLTIFTSVSFTSLISLGAFVVFITLQTQYQTIYWIQILELIAYWWDISWYYQGREAFKQLLVRSILVKSTYLISIFLLIRDADDLPLYVFLRCVTLFIGSVVILFPVLRNAWKERLPILWRTIPHHLKGMFFLFLPSIAMMVYTVLDKTMIGVMTRSPAQNGWYEEAIKMIRVLLHIVGTISIVLLPRVASLHAQGAHAEIEAKVHRSFAFIYCLTFPMIGGIYFIADRFVPWFLGPGFEGAIILLQTLSVLLLFIGLGRLLGTTLVSMGREHLYTRNILFGAGVNFILNLFLIPRYQALGAAWASVIAELVVTCAMLHANRDILIFRHLLQATLKYLVALTGMCVLLWLIQAHLTGSILWQLTILVGAGLITYAGLLLLQREMFVEDILKRLRARFKGRMSCPQ